MHIQESAFQGDTEIYMQRHNSEAVKSQNKTARDKGIIM